MTADIVNLRAKRKEAARKAARAVGDAAAAKSGRTPAQRRQEADDATRAKAALDGKKLSGPDPV